MKNNYQICEYGTVRNQSDYPGIPSTLNELYLPTNHFNSLYQYVLQNQSSEKNKDIPFSVFKKNNKDQIKVKNFVGIIENQEGLSLEVLPKVYKHDKLNSLADTRIILLTMLKVLADSPFVNINTAHLRSDKDFPILEVFIQSYVEETEKLFSKEIRSDYIVTDENLNYLKGKLLIPENIRNNFINKAKFYCEYSDYSPDILQNRIIKTTLRKLLRVTRNYKNYASINKLLTHVEGVKYVVNIAEDLQKVSVSNRFFKPYEQLLKWSEVFLLNKGLTNFRGDTLNLAILYPMERVFENYIAYLFKKHANVSRIKAQDRSYYLVEKHINSEKFLLRPDLYIEKNSFENIIIDTKWKLIDATKPKENYKIQISDMYQLYAYGKKYSRHKPALTLAIIYPKNEFFKTKLQPFVYENDLFLNIYPFDFDASPSAQIQDILADN